MTFCLSLLKVDISFLNSLKYLDKLKPEAEKTQSVNTIYLKNEKVIGHNTDIAGFELGIRSYGYDIKKKNVFIFQTQ